MPRNLVDDAGSFPAQTSPVAGEPRTAGSVETPFQRAANRVAYVKRRLDIVQVNDEGVRRLRSVPSLSALKTVTDRPDGTIIEVSGVGLYRFDGASALGELAPLVIAPTGAATGRWLVHDYGQLNVANGIPRLDGSGRLPTERLAASGGGQKIKGESVANGLVALVTKSTTSTSYTSSGTYTDVSSSDVVLNMIAGDRAVLVGQGYQYRDDLTDQKHFTRWVAVQPNMTVAPIAASEQWSFNENSNEETPISIGTYFVATMDGLHTLKMQHKNSGSGGSVAVASINVIALHFRP